MAGIPQTCVVPSRQCPGDRLQGMDRVEGIEAAISSLPPDDYRRLARWFREIDQARWDEQIDRDSL
jgi:hypothetical protein